MTATDSNRALRARLLDSFVGTRPPPRLDPATTLFEHYADYLDVLSDFGREDSQFRHAAVLVPLIDRPEGLTILLTRRTEHLNHHGGQISFPGGIIEEYDDDATAAALRETEEEVGIQPDEMQVVGYLPSFETFTAYSITPVLALVQPDYTLNPEEFEVAEVFEVPLRFLLDPANRGTGHREGAKRRVEYSFYQYEQHYIWGATAGMLGQLVDRLTSSQSVEQNNG